MFIEILLFVKDILQNDDIEIDWMFKFSFAVDIAKVKLFFLLMISRDP